MAMEAADTIMRFIPLRFRQVLGCHQVGINRFAHFLVEDRHAVDGGSDTNRYLAVVRSGHLIGRQIENGARARPIRWLRVRLLGTSDISRFAGKTSGYFLSECGRVGSGLRDAAGEERSRGK